MENTVYQLLSEAERADLRICGIDEKTDFRRLRSASVWRDLQQAQEFFPQHSFCLTEQRLRDIFIGEDEPTPEPQPDRLPSLRRVVERQASPASEEAVISKKVDLRELEANEAELSQPGKKQPGNAFTRQMEVSKRTHATRFNKPFGLLLASLTAILFPFSILTLIAAPIIVLLDLLPEVEPWWYLIILFVCAFPYLMFGLSARCNVCHSRILRFTSYPHNKFAHHFPLLGYTVSTALHILFCLNFYCPACGTLMKLFGGDHRHHHHHH